ncbi:unnamed protein product [Rotaria sp. Silwood1]|nr:unnamed protein product [Rotaria sp. Silwood1]
MNPTDASTEEVESLHQQTVLLDIPPRLQWDNGNGYCGETALQCIDYDHIVPAIGIQYKNPNGYDPDDKLIYYDLYEKTSLEGTLSEDEMGSTRTMVSRKPNAEDGCIPLEIDYGIAITGIIDEDRVTLPVRLVVSAWNEPNPAFHEDSTEMDGAVTVYNLTVGNTYVLFRYSSYKDVQTKGDANAFFQSRFDVKHEFVADDTTYVYEDPKKIPSNGSVYYRCISRSVDLIDTN